MLALGRPGKHFSIPCRVSKEAGTSVLDSKTYFVLWFVILKQITKLFLICVKYVYLLGVVIGIIKSMCSRWTQIFGH